MTDTMKLVRRGYSAADAARSETLFTVANGTFGLRGDYEERAGCFHKGTYINGFFDSEPIVYGESAFGYAKEHQTLLNVPDPKNVELTVNGHPFSLDSGTVASFSQTLDFRSGLMTRLVDWIAPDGTCVRIRSERLVPFTRSTCAAIRYDVTVTGHAGDSGHADDSGQTGDRQPVTVRIESAVDASVRNLSAEDDPRVGAKFSSAPLLIDRLSAVPAETDGFDVVSFGAHTRNSGLLLAGTVLSRYSVFEAGGAHTADAVDVCDATEVAAEAEFTDSGECSVCGGRGCIARTFSLAAGQSVRLEKFISYDTARRSDSASNKKQSGSRNGEPQDGTQTGEQDAPLAAFAMVHASEAASAGFPALCREQRAYLDDFWRTAAVSIGADSESERAVRFSLFHLLQSAGKDGRTSIAAKGLTAEGYEGHFFWDSEAYVCPVFTYLKPSVAASLLRFRIGTLPAARERAAQMNAAGALFPWRTIDGAETSAYFPAGTAQYHINADIMFALNRLLTAVPGGAGIPERDTAELAAETARMWMSLGSYIPEKGGRFCINEVTGPDEYTACVNNNAYTNLMARENLRISAALCAHAGSGVSEAERESWLRAADSMYVPYDAASGVYPQDDSFMEKAPWDFAGTPPDHYPLLLHYHPLVIYRYRVLKQPDLVLAQFLLPDQFSLAEKIRNFRFYEPYTTGDSSLSHCIQSIMACEIGDGDKAERYFRRTVAMDIADEHGNTRDGIHTACMAGSWMALVYGFAGFRDYGGKWRFAPQLPRSWTSLSFSLLLRGQRLTVEILPDSVTYSLGSPDAAERPPESASSFIPALSFFHRNRAVTLRCGESRSFSLRSELKAVLCDLDGVITDTAELHYQAWQKIANRYGLHFDRAVNEKLRGVSREASLELILAHNRRISVSSGGEEWTPERIKRAAAEKNGVYVSLLENLGPADILPGIAPLFTELRERGIKIILASASANAPEVCRRLGITERFDAIVDPASVKMMKPEPDIFLAAAALAGVWHTDCVGIEDAQAGIDALNAAGIKSVGIGAALRGADLTVCDTSLLEYRRLAELF
ncbi:beta-phosphoglucomutase [Treponema brennaborense]|uniref:Beta-phosphoglucomutase n=1 Tax=Treponema brennaborense (strain DSM 12168 / CIP 105900 / DD5/3) TaxID=906968 RepID=F4LNL6_TREBD|nr:beta-phosphoglucomutase [Treponema brennaborense]AEE15870.1 beta-phosphoglucomutase [Treponema brennaborense DSM 12168]